MSTKSQLRKIYFEKRKQLSVDECSELNQLLLKRFQELNFSGITCIHIFLPISSKREPDTLLCIQWLRSKHPQIQISYPKTDFSTLSITNYLNDADLKLEESKMGITEPISGNIIDVNTIDMVFVPLLTFDKKGYRVGYGKGFYDRFMATCKPEARFVGLSLFEPVDAIEDIDQYDIPLHQCITPQKTWEFN
ncbi:5-formyltetrahydrofolate cyclo-ligase [Mucilaginibacter sp. HMF5004]|uniref:5-formyltetrahydrofolate cyclo-ligase n=1 Tax=Mucilaginibacter rivuli TaxID=2857527 RepID=UPI001C5D8A55|nr:5-formyltetrahydrofolate cyclo-ligase [Mucilaginibacter rivuli]MBW4890448.1 5-formyltetrahydrofolate cyclo-ligase [Mucilaginibacter rivuli]